ncbi:hypothetical protein PPYR_03224 [Photinus pyralis]|uniref:Major facilitator superfamily (MFS) profile domain-containing protein n=2 Tax=Photinus pyralis TaxID=7054 RepID=A0A5N4A263_PHOPY|nr:putative inorganic phosphate cotransporter [Photinus pyralis]KAB0791424.1 hypothetical protein PPYR_03224 [Photinus pyralis]
MRLRERGDPAAVRALLHGFFGDLLRLHAAPVPEHFHNGDGETSTAEGGRDRPANRVSSFYDEKTKKDGEYPWTASEKAAILSSFFPGYILTHIPGGFMADAYGAKHVLGIGVAISAVLSALTPVAIDIGGVVLLCITRIVMGLAQGPLFPAVTTFLARWVPKAQRGRLGGLVFTGPQIGSIIANALTGVLISAFGWRCGFYFWAVIGLVWFVIYCLLCYSEPAIHPYITPEEKEMLIAECGSAVKLKVPWMKLIFYWPTFALMMGQSGHGILFFFICTNLPTYFKDVLQFSVSMNGLLTSVPYAALWISGAISAVIADTVINKGLISIVGIRKLYTTIASVLPSICVLLAGYAGCNQYLAASWFILSMFFKGPFYPGLRVNALDITKYFSGVLSAFVNAAGSLAYYPVSYIIAAVAPQNTLDQWMIMFWIMFGTSSITNIIYVIWASADRAEWDKIE